MGGCGNLDSGDGKAGPLLITTAAAQRWRKAQSAPPWQPWQTAAAHCLLASGTVVIGPGLGEWSLPPRLCFGQLIPQSLRHRRTLPQNGPGPAAEPSSPLSAHVRESELELMVTGR